MMEGEVFPEEKRFLPPAGFDPAFDDIEDSEFLDFQVAKDVSIAAEEDRRRLIEFGNRMLTFVLAAIADDGELIVLAPAVGSFGEDPEIDELIRKYGYRTTPEIMELVRQTDDLPQNLSAAAHLIHGSSEGRFRITYCPGKLSREEIEAVGYQYSDLTAMRAKYDPRQLNNGWNEMPDGERIFYIDNPALGLWAHRQRLQL